ncbi:MAG: PEGA domain-containing protein [Deltaproteobacteria bacterium]|nr:PEGA domain-containing protein [Deltaproteobacteria bacterium]
MQSVRALALTAASMLCAFPVSAYAEGSSLSMQKRQKLGLILITPSTSVRGKVGQSELQSSLRQVLERRTDFALEEIPSARVSDCQGSLKCMVKRVRSDYDETKIDKSKPFSTWLSELRAKNVEYPLYLVLMTVQTEQDRPDRLASMLINTDAALRFVHEGADQETIDQQILERAVVVRTPRTDVNSEEEASAYLTRLVEVEFKNEFENSGNWEPFGAVLVQAKVPGLEVVVDEQLIGTTLPGETRISDVPAGSHVIQLKHPEYELFRSEVIVKRGETTTLEAEVISKGGAFAFGPKEIVFWSGVLAATVGTVVTIAAVTHASSHSDWKIYCIHSEGEANCGSGKVFWSLSAVFSDPQPGFTNPNEGSLLAAPFGYSLIGTGATWAVGSQLELFTEKDEFPWIPLVAGVVVGGISYGISAAMNGETAFDAQK